MLVLSLANIYFDCVARDATIHPLRDTYVAHLRSVVEVQFYINQLLYDLENNIPIDTEEKYECFQLFYFIEQVFFDGKQVTRQYHFKSEADYMVFLLLHFVESGLQICCCKCCGRYFVPRTKRKTLYCDRIIRNSQTCKELAPSLKHKLAARNERVVAEYAPPSNEFISVTNDPAGAKSLPTKTSLTATTSLGPAPLPRHGTSSSPVN